MAYNPRTLTGIPTEGVGSLPRPMKLQEAYSDYDHGRIKLEQLEAEQEIAVKDSITRMEATGAPIISDGEQRWSSFATYPLTDTLAGTGLAKNLGGGRPEASLRRCARRPAALHGHDFRGGSDPAHRDLFLRRRGALPHGGRGEGGTKRGPADAHQSSGRRAAFAVERALHGGAVHPRAS